jgi:hypothetical protein
MSVIATKFAGVRCARSAAVGSVSRPRRPALASAGHLIRQAGLTRTTRHAGSAWLSGDPGEAGALDDLIGHSITYRLAVCPRAGHKLFTLRSIASQPERAGHHGVTGASGFSPHAGLEMRRGERARLERFCRYVSRPPVTTERLALTPSGQVRFQLKTSSRDGTTHVVPEPCWRAPDVPRHHHPDIRGCRGRPTAS